MSFYDLERTHFCYDSTLGPETTQEDVYELAVAPSVSDIFNGINSTVMVLMPSINLCFTSIPHLSLCRLLCRHMDKLAQGKGSF